MPFEDKPRYRRIEVAALCPYSADLGMNLDELVLETNRMAKGNR